MKIAVDVMGGDKSPGAPIRGALAYAAERPDVHFSLIGPSDVVQQIIGSGKMPNNVDIAHAPAVIDAGEEAVRAVRKKTDSSLVVAARMVREGQADVMVSSGNTGALVASGLLVVGRMEGIHRPALAPVLPTFDGKGVLLLDAGATMDATSDNLVQFAKMGSAYSRYVLGVDEPRVGLVNVGTEEGKGNALCKETFPKLAASNLKFVGNIEARDLLNGVVDVAVCDGFVGNVVLKLVEGVGLGIISGLKGALTSTVPAKLAAAMLKPSLKRFLTRFDYAEYGGAPFLGVAGGCIKAHGSSNERAWYTALRQAVRYMEQDMNSKIKVDLADVIETPEEAE